MFLMAKKIENIVASTLKSCIEKRRFFFHDFNYFPSFIYDSVGKRGQCNKINLISTKVITADPLQVFIKRERVANKAYFCLKKDLEGKVLIKFLPPPPPPASSFWIISPFFTLHSEQFV